MPEWRREERHMWYVIQTVGGQEQAVRALIERRSSGDASNLVEQ